MPVGARFSAPVQTGPGTHQASCTMGTGSFPGVESGRGVTLTPHPFLVPRSKNTVELNLYSPYGPSWPVKRVKPTYSKSKELRGSRENLSTSLLTSCHTQVISTPELFDCQWYILRQRGNHTAWNYWTVWHLYGYPFAKFTKSYL
jgi:hypothetical protein